MGADKGNNEVYVVDTTKITYDTFITTKYIHEERFKETIIKEWISAEFFAEYLLKTDAERRDLFTTNETLRTALTRAMLHTNKLQQKNASLKTTIAKQKTDIAKMEQKLSTIKQNLTQSERAWKNVQTRLDAQEKALDNLKKRHGTATELVQSKTAALTALQVENTNAQQQIQEHRAAFDQLQQEVEAARALSVKHTKDWLVTVLPSVGATFDEKPLWEQLILDMSPDLMINPYMKELMITSGAKLVDGKYVLDNPQKYQEVSKKIQEYQWYLEFLNEKTTLIQKVNKFVELSWTDKEYIVGRNVLLLDYMKNISEDLKANSSFFTKKDGAYTVERFWATPIEDTAAEAILLDSTKIAPKYLDFVVLYQVLDWNSSAFLRWKEIHQKDFINTLLKKYFPKIVRKDDITNILAPWTPEELKKAIWERKPKSIQEAQDLAYLKNIISKAQGWTKAEGNLESMFTWNKDVFSDLNTFKKTQDLKGLIWEAIWWDKNTPITEENIWKLISSQVMKNLPLIAVASLFLLFANKKLAWGLMVGSIAAIIVGNIAGDLQKKGISKNSQEIDIKSVSEFGTKPEYISSEPRYQETYEKLESVNNTNHKEEDVWIPTVKDNYILGAIFKEMISVDSKKTLNSIKVSDLEDPLKKDAAITKIKGNILPWWTSKKVADFWITAPDWYIWEVTNEDVEAFIKLLVSQKETDDKTVTDLLESGTFILNQNYTPQNMSSDEHISTMLNDTLWDAYKFAQSNNNETALEKYKKLQTETSSTIGWNWIKTAINIVEQGAKNAMNWSGTNQAQRVDTLIAYVDWEFKAESTSSDPYKTFREEYIKELNIYKLYLKQDEELEEQKGFVDETGDLIIQFTSKHNPFWKPSDALARIKKLEGNIKKLWEIESKLKAGLNANQQQQDPFKTMLEKITELKKTQERYKLEIKDKMNTGVLSLLKDKTLLETWTFDMAKETLSQDSEKFLDQVKSSQNEIAELLDDTSDIRLEDSEQAMKDYGKVILRQDANYKAFTDANSNWLNATFISEPKKATAALLKDYYQKSKSELKIKLERPLVDFYKDNNKQKSELDKIKLPIPSINGSAQIIGSTIEDDIKILEATNNFLEDKWIPLDKNGQKALDALIEKIKHEKNELQRQINKENVASNPNTTQIGLWKKTVNGFDDAINSISTYTQIAWALTKWRYHKIEKAVWKLSDILTDVSLDSINNGIQWTFSTVKDYIKDKKKDDVAKGALREWNDVFGSWVFLSWVNSKTTLNNVKQSFEIKRWEVIQKVKDKVDNIYSLANLAWMSSANLNLAYKDLGKLKEIKYIDSTLRESIEHRQDGYNDANGVSVNWALDYYMLKTTMINNKDFLNHITTIEYNDPSWTMKNYLDSKYQYTSTPTFNQALIEGMSISDFFRWMKNNNLLSTPQSGQSKSAIDKLWDILKTKI